MNLVVAAAVEAAIGPYQRVIAKRVHGSYATPVVPAVAARFGADIGARERITQAIPDETQTQTCGSTAQKSLITGVIPWGHIAFGDQHRGTAGRQAGAVRTARAVGQAKAFIGNLDAVEVGSVGH